MESTLEQSDQAFVDFIGERTQTRSDLQWGAALIVLGLVMVAIVYGHSFVMLLIAFGTVAAGYYVAAKAVNRMLERIYTWSPPSAHVESLEHCDD